MKNLQSEEAASDSFKYEGGSDDEGKMEQSMPNFSSGMNGTKTMNTFEVFNFQEMTKKESENELPPINTKPIAKFESEMSELIYDPHTAAPMKNSQSQNSVSSEKENQEENEDDYSVYEVKSDGKDEKDGVADNIGLMESEARSGENMKTVLIFLILFGVLIFSAAICIHIAFNLPSSVAGWCIILLIIV